MEDGLRIVTVRLFSARLPWAMKVAVKPSSTARAARPSSLTAATSTQLPQHSLEHLVSKIKPFLYCDVTNLILRSLSLWFGSALHAVERWPDPQGPDCDFQN
jgi:hypothetical protein